MRRLVLALLLVLASLVPAAAREEIRSFATDIELRADGSVLVTETIDINAEGIEIRRGIFRDIPVVMLDDGGNRLRPALDVVSVTRDGSAEPYRVERMGDFLRIWIGDSSAFVSRGEHRYVVRYAMSRMARYFADYDELYFNATGNYWIFPILGAVASVRLPEGAAVADVQGYTGRPGSTEQAVSVSSGPAGRVVIRATRPLAAGEGLTVSVSLAKGVLVEPESITRLTHWFADRQDVIVPTALVLLVLGYFSLAWRAVGRDPPKGTIIPLFHPPQGFSPALTHYVHYWGWRGWTAFTASAFNLGVKELVTIDNAENGLTLTATGKEPGEPLPPSEAVLFGFLKSRQSLTIGKAVGSLLAQKRAEFTNAVETENRNKWFRDHLGYSVLGFVVAALALAAMVWLGYLELAFLVLAGVLGIFLGIAVSLFRSAWSGGNKVQFLFVGVWIAGVGVNMAGGFGALSTNALVSTGLIAAVSIVAICILFAVLMRAPTVQGRKVMDEIDGFKLYLDTAEKERLNITDEPPMTVERFERILPYAVALGVEKPWTEHFEAELARNAVAGVTGDSYAPHWYRGSDGRGFTPSELAHSVSSTASAMSAAMVAAQPSTSSSSGFGGGGSSGGGGGGGGGGGW